jgi:hypothetical protein
MSYNFGDSFDLYAASTDMASYWDTAANGSFAAGRFANSRGWQVGFNVSAVKASNVNDAVHHLCVRARPELGHRRNLAGLLLHAV